MSEHGWPSQEPMNVGPIHDEGLDERMAALSDEAIRVAEDVWTEDEPTLAEYEPVEAIIAARAADRDAGLRERIKDEAERNHVFMEATGGYIECSCGWPTKAEWEADEHEVSHILRAALSAPAGNPTGQGLEDVERLAEALSWTSGEMTRWQPDAHPDHNRWSWRGDGHGEAMRTQFREQAAAIRAHLADQP